MAHPIVSLGIFRESVLGWVFITSWKMCAHRSGNLTLGSAAADYSGGLLAESMVFHSLLPSLILSSIRAANRYLLRVHHEPLRDHQQSGICQALEGTVWKRWWQFQKWMLWSREQAGQRKGEQEMDISEKSFPSLDKFIQLDCGVSELEAISKIILSLSL